MATVTLTQIEDVAAPADPKEYKLTTTFTLASTPPGGTWDNNFILAEKGAGALATDVYQHTCTVGDIETYDTKIGRASVAVGEYYRIDTFDTFYDSLEDMRALVTTQQTKAQYLVDDWTNYVPVGGFPDTTVTAVTPS